MKTNKLFELGWPKYGVSAFDSIIDKFLNDSFPSLKDDGGITIEGNAYPRVDIYEDDGAITIEADCHGYKQSDIKVEYDQRRNLISIKGKRILQDAPETRKYHHREIKRSSFERSFLLGKNANGDGAEVKFSESGNLVIKIPYAPPENSIKRLM